MTDLIWVGNTLLPRWLVFATVLLICMSPLIVGCIVRACLKRRH